MHIRTLDSHGRVDEQAAVAGFRSPADGWIWIDVTIEQRPEDAVEFAAQLGLDELAVRDAIHDHDLPKIDDFGDHMLVVLHGVREGGGGEVETYELDCFVTNANQIITIHHGSSPSVDALWARTPKHPELLTGTCDELLARLSDISTRRFLAVLDAFDDRVDDLIAAALDADQSLIGEVAAVRADLRELRRAIHPQREVLDILRTTTSPLVREGGRRRFADAFDVAVRATAGAESARVALVETIDAYRSAEARVATDVSRVLTIYAAIMLPLSLIAGFFGMNFENLPGTGNDDGWVWVAAVMAALTMMSLSVFVVAGWIRPPGGRAGRRLGRGLVDAVRSPVGLAGALFVRASGRRRSM